MAVELSWYIPKLVVLARSYGTNTLEDAQLINDWILERHPADAKYRIHLIADASAVEKNSMSLNDVRTIARMPRISNFGYIILVNNSRLKVIQNMLMTVASQFIGIRFRSVDSLDEGVKFLAFFDPYVAEAIEKI